MNSSIYIANGLRFVFLLLLQALVFQNVQLGKSSIYIYTIFLILLPLELLQAAALVIAFLYGLLIDMFSDMDGLHAAVSVWIIAWRPIVCGFLEPRGGYQIGQTLTRHSLGIRWFLKYSAVMVANHTFFIVLLEDLSFSWIGIVRFLLSFLLSWFLVILYQFIFNPKN